GASVLISTHMLDSVEELWDVANIMMDGKIAAVRSRQETEAKKEDLEGLFFSITEGASAKDKEETE
ncbi:MAG: ABC transporter ATP-binding protein, partial [Clostridia bacterium]